MLPNSPSSLTSGFWHLVAVNLQTDFLQLDEDPKFMAMKFAMDNNLSTKTKEVVRLDIIAKNTNMFCHFFMFLCLFWVFFINILKSKIP